MSEKELIEKTETLDSSACPIAKTAALIGDKWILMILQTLMDGPKRFNQIQYAVENISPKTLTERLKSMESMGFITRKVYPETPVKIEYSLTKKAEDLGEVIFAMMRFGLNYEI